MRRSEFIAAQIVLVLSLLILSAFIAPARATTPPNANSPPFDAGPVNIANDGMHAYAPGIGASGSTVAVAWADETPNTTPGTVGLGDRCPAAGQSTAKDPGVYDLMVAVSGDGGKTYGKPIDLSNRGVTFNFGLAVQVPLGGLYCGGNQFWTSPHIRVAVSGSNIYVVWGENVVVQGDDLDTGHATGIFFAYSSNGGGSFSTAVNLAGTGDSGNAFDPEIAASGNNVYIVWEDHSTGKDVSFDKSTSGGSTFSGVVNLSSNGNSAVPRVGAAGNIVVVVWQDDTISTGDIGMKRSNDGGATFLKELNVSHDGAASDPQLGVTSTGSAMVAWQDGSGSATTTLGDIFVGGSSDGATAGGIIDLTGFHGPSQPAIGAAYDPQVAVTDSSGSAITFVAWLDTSPGYVAVYGGIVAGSSSSHVMTDSNVVPSNPRTAAIGNDFFVTWTDNTMGPPEELEFATGTAPSSISCCDGVVITLTSQTNDGRTQGSMASAGNKVFTTWHDHTQPQGQVDVRAYTDPNVSPVATTTTATTTVTTSTGGGIPEFPFQFFAVSVFTTLIVASYLVARRARP